MATRRIAGPAQVAPSRRPTSGPRSAPRLDAFEVGTATPVDTASSLSAHVLAPSLTAVGYSAHFGLHQKRAFASMQGLTSTLSTRAERMPSFTAEAGKSFTVTVDNNYLAARLEKVELVWRMAPTGQEHAITLSDGTRDAAGHLNLAPATFEVPSDAFGVMRLIVRTTTVGGAVEDRWDTSHDALIVPNERAMVSFSEDWQPRTEKMLRPGEGLTIDYDRRRASALFNGAQPSRITAKVAINEEPAQDVELISSDGQHFRPTVPLPLNATLVNLWFEAEHNGAVAYDSAFGKNYRLNLGPARDEADPDWRLNVLGIFRCERLLDAPDSFVTIGPSTQRYNCIACSIGVRDEWVWPGDAVADFDRLYGAHGYHPINDLDFSLDPASDKVVLYGLRLRAGVFKPTHAAKQTASGEWVSKLGSRPLIRHQAVEAVGGLAYGDAMRVYVRPRRVPEW